MRSRASARAVGNSAGEKVDVELQIAARVKAVNDEGSAMPIGRNSEDQARWSRLQNRRDSWERRACSSEMSSSMAAAEEMRSDRRQRNSPGSDVEAKIETESKSLLPNAASEDAANLLVIAGDLEFFGRTADREIVHENLRLVERAMRNAGQFSELEVAEMLNADPDADAENRKHQAQRTTRRPQQEQAQHGEDGGNAIKQDHDLAVRHAMLQELVMNVLGVGCENRPSADQPANHGQNRLEDRQAERDDRNRDGYDCRALSARRTEKGR